MSQVFLHCDHIIHLREICVVIWTLMKSKKSCDISMYLLVPSFHTSRTGVGIRVMHQNSS